MFGALALAAAVGAAAASVRPAAKAPQPRTGEPIREIRFETRDVFDSDEPGENNLVFRLANRAHARTKTSVIAHELLFGVGDPYDPDLLEETERNLRRLSFLRKVEVFGVPTSSGPVVVVRTWDAWTLETVLTFQRAGGVSRSRLGLADRNLLGYGKSLSLIYTMSGGAVDRSVAYRDPQFLGKRLENQISAGTSTHDKHARLLLGRPFYASVTRSSLLGRADYVEDRWTVYDGLAPAGSVDRRRYETGLAYGYAFEASTRRTRRLTAGLTSDRADYAAAPGETARWIPEREQHTALELGAEYLERRFIKQRRIRKLSRDEDYNMGLGLLASLAYAPRWRDLGTTGERLTPKLAATKGFSSELGQFLLLEASYSSTYVNGGNGLRLARLDAEYFCRFFPRHTVAGRLALDHGWRLDGRSQLTLGEDNGLRGYRADQFRGNRRMIVNVEDRVFLFDNVLKLVDAGAVLFFDSGYVWGQDKRFALGDLKSSVGFGLRFGATRSAGNDPMRIDVARALNDNRFPSRWTLSLKAGHSF